MRVRGYEGPISDHFDGERFINLDPVQTKTFSQVLKWRLTSRRAAWPARSESATGATPPPRPQAGTIRYCVVNHATVLIQTATLNILTDPIWSERTSPLRWVGPRRVCPPGLAFDQLPPIDVVLLSHNHYDHLDLDTLQRLEERDQPRILAGLGNAAFLKSFGFSRVDDLDWWQRLQVKGTPIHFVPGRHFSSRGLSDRYKTLWGGFVIENIGAPIYFAGDTGYGRHFRMIREKFGPMDLSFLPIGAYEPRWFMRDVHMNPQEAVQAHRDLDSRKSVGIHFGTFQLTDEAIDAPARDLAISRQAQRLSPDMFQVPVFGTGYDHVAIPTTTVRR